MMEFSLVNDNDIDVCRWHDDDDDDDDGIGAFIGFDGNDFTMVAMEMGIGMSGR